MRKMKRTLLVIGMAALLLGGCGTEVSQDSVEVKSEESNIIVTDPRFEVMDSEDYQEAVMSEFDYACYVHGIYLSATEEEYICIQPIEWIESDDEERIQELGLTEADLVSGYCIMDDSDELLQLKITDETKYIFLDWYNEYVEPDNGRAISTTDESFFLDYLQSGYGENANQYPLFIWLKEDGSVERLMEKPLA